MGGYGSGRTDGQIKMLVEDCYGLSVKTIKEHIKDIDLKSGMYYGTVYWTSRGEKEAEISYRVNKSYVKLSVQLIYQITNSRTREVTKADYPIEIQNTVPNYEGNAIGSPVP